MSFNGKKRGFTIVELVIVMAVIAILAGILIPTFASIVRASRQSRAYQEATAEYMLYRTTFATAVGEHEADHVLIRVDTEGETYLFVALDNARTVDEEPKTIYNGIIYNGTISGYSTELDPTARTWRNTYNVQNVDQTTGLAKDISEDIPDNLYNVMLYELALEQEPYIVTTPDSVDPSGEPGDVIDFGYYPQTDVTGDRSDSTSLGYTLEKWAGIRDENGDLVLGTDGTPKYLPKEGTEVLKVKEGDSNYQYKWVSYKYYSSGDQADYAWYIDVEDPNDTYAEDPTKNVVYRGMYFVKYRPTYTDNAAYISGNNNSYKGYQRDNGYYMSGADPNLAARYRDKVNQINEALKNYYDSTNSSGAPIALKEAEWDPEDFFGELYDQLDYVTRPFTPYYYWEQRYRANSEYSRHMGIINNNINKLAYEAEYNIYWFRYDPIKWTITDIVDGKYTVRCNVILDAQHYQSQVEKTNLYTSVNIFTGSTWYSPRVEGTASSLLNLNSLTYISGTNIFANNWQESEVKQWLGVPDNSGNWSKGTFAYTAFGAGDRARIVQPTALILDDEAWAKASDGTWTKRDPDKEFAYKKRTDSSGNSILGLTRNGGWDYHKSGWSWWGDVHRWGGTYEYDDDAGLYKRKELFDTYAITYTDVTLYLRSSYPNTSYYYNSNYHISDSDVGFGLMPLGDMVLENNYIWLPSYEEIVGPTLYRSRAAVGGLYYTIADASDPTTAWKMDARTMATDYAAAQGGFRNSSGYGTYWLRTSSARNTFRISFVADNGAVGYVDNDKRLGASNCDDVTAAYLGIRPVMCIQPS